MDILVGLQYGDEGKGKITDLLSRSYDVVARFQGGNNAGHTIFKNGNKVVLNLIPSGIVADTPLNLLGQGMVIDPVHLKYEIENLIGVVENPIERIFISDHAHLITPKHIEEDKKENAHIGTTMKGIGPAYRDKTYRKGYRVDDIFGEKIYNEFRDYPEFIEALEFMKNLNIVDSMWLVEMEHLGKKILAEGAQGTMLDIEHGTYPYVTCSNTISSYAPIGLGMNPRSIDKVFGVTKSYTTRVGTGDLPTEIDSELSDKLQKLGNEFGATTGRMRSCSWLNLDELKYSIYLNGVSELIITKLDILSDMPVIQIYNNEEYIDFEPWETNDMSDKRFADFIEYIETNTNTKVSIASISPDRTGVIYF